MKKVYVGIISKVKVSIYIQTTFATSSARNSTFLSIARTKLDYFQDLLPLLKKH